MDFREIKREAVDWIHRLRKGKRWAVMNTVMNLRVPERVGNFLTT
jgi:hypothetical protein